MFIYIHLNTYFIIYMKLIIADDVFQDNLSKLLKLQSRLGNYVIIKPGRTFIKEGELQKLSRKEIQPRYFILVSYLPMPKFIYRKTFQP